MTIQGRRDDIGEADKSDWSVGRPSEPDAGLVAVLNTVSGTVSGGVVQAHTITGGVHHHHHHTEFGRPVPWQLPMQSGWRWCDRCQGLYFGGGWADSCCPAGGTHRHADQSGSGDYSLPMNAVPAADRQSGWRWCDRCQGMYFGPEVARSRCPAGSTHAVADQSGRADYGLFFGLAPNPVLQSGWRWCDKCRGLFFGPGTAKSRCPAGGTHRPPEQSHSGNYSLPHLLA